MLTGLSIENVVLIDRLALDLDSGLTALTGETGAGKSIVLDALGMATGARSDRGLVRSGTDKAKCTASFSIDDAHGVWPLLDEAGMERSDDELVLRREISKDGRSRAFINDVPVGVKLLSSVGASLLEVHGQHDGRGLLNPTEHIHMLDAYGRYEPLLKACRDAHSHMKDTSARLEALEAKAKKSAEDREFLAHAVAELDRLDARAGEEGELAAERRFLQGAEGALSELSSAQLALGDQGAFEDRLAMALAGIDRVKSKLGNDNMDALRVLDNAATALEKAMLETQEARAAVSDAAGQFDVKPGQLDKVEKRLFALRGAARKYDTQTADLLAKRHELAKELEKIENIDQDLQKARAEAETAKAAYSCAADALTKARHGAASSLDAAVAGELPPLKMERASFRTDIEPGAPKANGQDQVRFQVSTNPGTAMGPLDKIASGGELARFALAIKVALSGVSNKVMVFDEVDQGVGGAVADAVGRRLAALAQAGQVFVVTHSPQVAASADHQFRIEKSSSGVTTTTNVVRVNDGEREEEIARMLAGETITQEARAAARRLMKAS